MANQEDRAPAGNWSGNAGKLWTMEARNLFRLLAVTSWDSGRLKLSCSSLLPHSFSTSEYPFFGLLENNSLTLYRNVQRIYYLI